MKFLIAALGNIGAEYKNTRHNIGFQIADQLVREKETVFTTDRYADVARVKVKGKILVVIKPSTYMNLSGKAVRYWLEKEKIPQENLLVLSDDIALPFGVCRIRMKGGDGGHNGLTDIIAQLGSDQFARLRFGLGNEFPRGHQVDFVLGQWSADETKLLEERMKHAIKIIESFVHVGIEKTMTGFNKK